MAALLAGCARTPITVSPGEGGTVAAVAPAPSRASAARLIDDGPPCTVRLEEVRDARPNPNDLGMMGPRPVHASDSVAWLQSALAPMKQDRRLRFVDTDAEAALLLRVELVKAYILTQNTQKSSNVVLRAVYSRDGKDLDAQVARGRDEGVDWMFGEEEAQGSLNRALAAAVLELDNDIAVRCRASK